MDEKRAKNVCYCCDEKYTPGHRYKRKEVYVLQIKEAMEDHDEDIVKEEVVKEEAEVIQEGQLLLNALWGRSSNQTMMIKGNSGRGVTAHERTSFC